MTCQAAVILSRMTDLVARFRDKRALTHVAPNRIVTRGRPRLPCISTRTMIRQLSMPIARREQILAKAS